MGVRENFLHTLQTVLRLIVRTVPEEERMTSDWVVTMFLP